jgi:hypothetical protein
LSYYSVSGVTNKRRFREKYTRHQCFALRNVYVLFTTSSFSVVAMPSSEI